MTSLAFIFGCVPLWVATGAGAAARRVLGTAVVSGMLAATLFGIFFIPALFVAVEGLTSRKGKRAQGSGDAREHDEATVHPPLAVNPAGSHAE
jgi:HAE1 family hydrophobic/amphiphilic exporter-1